MKIEIWSDVVCPWCFIGKRRLEAALAGFEHADEVEVVYRSFELDPTAPRGGTEPTVTALQRKYGPGAPAMMDQVTQVAAGDGLAFRLGETQHYNTIDAHRLLHLALDSAAGGSPQRQRDLKEAFLHAHFEQGRNLSDPQVLTELAESAGIEARAVTDVLSGSRYAEDVQADIRQARAYGANGVPFFVVDQRYGVSGAQPVEAFEQLLTRAWDDAHPTPILLNTDNDAACGPDGCAI